MPVAFVLVSANPGSEPEILNIIRGLEHVTEVYVVYGIYDILVKIEAATIDDVKRTISAQIRSLDNIQATITLLSVVS